MSDKLLDAVFKPEADVQQLQDWSPSLDQPDPPEPGHIKEEQEELWSGQEEQQEEDIIKFTFTPGPVKSEHDDEEEPWPSQLHQTEQTKTEEACGGPEPDRSFNPESHLQPDMQDKTSSDSETDDSCDWEETSEPQPGLNNEVPGSDVESNTGEISVSLTDSNTNFDHKGHQQKQNGLQTEVKHFICSICGKSYHRKNSLTDHMRLHLEGKRFSCSVCEKTFQWQGQVTRHMRSHTGEKPFSCSVCGRRFALKEHLRQHSTTHTGEKPFSCCVCGRTFAQSSNLITHFRVHTGEKPFTCSVCNTSFKDSGNLSTHMRVHTGEKPFSCSVCGKGFAHKTHVKRHLTIHTGEKPFNCSICDRRFTRLQILNTHKCVGESSRSSI